MLFCARVRYEVVSNGESGYGRYDVMLCPLKENEPENIRHYGFAFEGKKVLIG